MASLTPTSQLGQTGMFASHGLFILLGEVIPVAAQDEISRYADGCEWYPHFDIAGDEYKAVLQSLVICHPDIAPSLYRIIALAQREALGSHLSMKFGDQDEVKELKELKRLSTTSTWEAIREYDQALECALISLDDN